VGVLVSIRAFLPNWTIGARQRGKWLSAADSTGNARAVMLAIPPIDPDQCRRRICDQSLDGGMMDSA